MLSLGLLTSAEGMPERGRPESPKSLRARVARAAGANVAILFLTPIRIERYKERILRDLGSQPGRRTRRVFRWPMSRRENRAHNSWRLTQNPLPHRGTMFCVAWIDRAKLKRAGAVGNYGFAGLRRRLCFGRAPASASAPASALVLKGRNRAERCSIGGSRGPWITPRNAKMIVLEDRFGFNLDHRTQQMRSLTTSVLFAALALVTLSACSSTFGGPLPSSQAYQDSISSQRLNPDVIQNR